MKAVWSLWTKPMNTGHSWAWFSPLHHLLSWVLSVELAKKHYSDTALFTDDQGAKMLVDGIGLEFDYVSTELNGLNNYDPSWWAIGKIYTYRAQQTPFTHIDNDVFLWNALPERMLSAPLLAQNPEYFIVGHSKTYKLDKFEAATKRIKNACIPEEWKWCRSVFGKHQKAFSCGIFGGNRVDFINYYADLAIKLIDSLPDEFTLSTTDNMISFTVILEQYLLSTCIDYQKNLADSPYKDLDIQCLFTFESALNDAAKLGYTHLIANSKNNQVFADRLAARVKNDYPQHYKRCVDYLNNI